MDFAKGLMKKYGWKEGDGLGKNNDGIEKPLKANYKFDNSGLGLDKAADFNNHWWERVYNDATNNLEIKNDENVTVAVKNAKGLEISTKEYSVNKLNKLTGSETYTNFLKSATLSSSGEVADPDRVNIDQIGLTKYKVLTDDELFAACGGRTAHKGARHGLKLSGKLSRIEEQERELLRKMNQGASSSVEITANDWQVVAAKKTKRKRKPESCEPKEDDLDDILHVTEYTKKSKKKRREKNKLENDLSSCLSEFSLKEELDNDGDVVLDLPYNSDEKDTSDKKSKKKKRKNRELLSESNSRERNTERDTFDEFDDQLTVNSLEVNISDTEQKPKRNKQSSKSKKNRKKEKKLMKKLTNSLENSVVITD